MKRALVTFLLIVWLILPASVSYAFSLFQPSTWPGFLNPHNWPFTLIPVPEVATNPNGGVTYGVLFATLFTNQKKQIVDIFAPDINNNADLGFGGTLRWLAYPSDNTQWYVMAGGTQDIARMVDLSYSTGRTHEKWWSLDARFYFERDPTERFFGIGNDSRLGKETNYTTEQLYVKLLLGWNITHDLQLALVERPRYVRILKGAFTTYPFIGKLFPNIKGLNGGTEIYNEIRLTYDTRDSIDIPHSGGLALLYAGIADRRFMSSVSYDRIGGELRHYWTFAKRFTLAGHVYLQYTPAGNETPFWTMARLGGQPSRLYEQQTLRGYGAGRFIDNNLFVANVELRTRIFELDIFGTHGIGELAPFFEAGRVFHTISESPVSDLHPVGGLGFRAIAEPFVVGYVDVGYGGEGVAVFSGINYPF